MGKNAGVNQLKFLKTLDGFRVTKLGFPKLNPEGGFSSGVTKRRLNGD
jgi:hypothetical protein